MGAAKNARKARRKARRREDRKLVFDMESEGSFGLQPTLLEQARRKLFEYSHLGDAFSDLFFGPTYRFRDSRGSSGKLSRTVEQALADRKAQGFDFPSYFDTHYLDKLLRNDAPRAGGVTGTKAKGITDIDFSSVEMRVLAAYADAKAHDVRIWDTIDKKRTYEAMYGMHPGFKYEDLYLQQWPDPIRPDELNSMPTGRIASHRPEPYLSYPPSGRVRSPIKGDST